MYPPSLADINADRESLGLPPHPNVRERAQLRLAPGGNVKVGRGPVSNPEGRAPTGANRAARRDRTARLRVSRLIVKAKTKRVAYWAGRR